MLVTLDDLRHRLFVTMHQSVVDGVSTYRIFPAELTTLYEAFCSGKPSPLLDMEFQYADFAYSDRQRVRGSAWNEQLAYWRQRLGNFQFHTWACVQPEALAGSCGAIQNFTVSEALYRDLKELCNSEGVTLFMVLLAGFAVLLSRYTEQKDIAVGSVTQSGRKHPEVQPLLGYFLNLVALRTDLSGDRTVREILQECREVTVGVLANDDVPWEIVMEELNRGLDSHSQAVLPTAITLAPSVTKLSPGWDQTPMDVDSGWAKWGLYLELGERPDGLLGRAQYSTDLLTSAAITRMLQEFISVLQAMVRNPSELMSALPTCVAALQ